MSKKEKLDREDVFEEERVKFDIMKYIKYLCIRFKIWRKNRKRLYTKERKKTTAELIAEHKKEVDKLPVVQTYQFVYRCKYCNKTIIGIPEKSNDTDILPNKLLINWSMNCKYKRNPMRLLLGQVGPASELRPETVVHHCNTDSSDEHRDIFGIAELIGLDVKNISNKEDIKNES